MNSCLIGSGQLLQKYGISVSEGRSKLSSRIYNTFWLMGIALNYLGEFGNWLALTETSPAVITPFGIVSVLINLVGASYLLKEVLSTNQIRGYITILFGVVGILYIAPKNEREPATREEVYKDITKLSNIILFGGLMAFLTLLVIYSRRPRTLRLYFYVLICAIFGTLSVSFGKMIAMLRQATDSTVVSIVEVILLSFIIFSTISQELFKQKTLAAYPVSKFIPLLYAGFNGW
ncbi:hypothetical protein HDV04_001465 [Boothiomyces sp. JEL0838]|nr:hypothetical protein HDV04_001465 [Boothiomyces sp. JEL0838]